VYKLGDLEMRKYDGENMNVHIPCWLTPGSADYLVIIGVGPYYGLLAAEWLDSTRIPPE
jgi:hypothetical protein